MAVTDVNTDVRRSGAVGIEEDEVAGGKRVLHDAAAAGSTTLVEVCL